MAENFTRNTQHVLSIAGHPKIELNQNDMLSDEKEINILNQGKFEQITGAVVDVETTQDNDQIYVDFKRVQDGKNVLVERTSIPKGATSMELKGDKLHLYKPDALGKLIDIEGSPVTISSGGGVIPFNIELTESAGNPDAKTVANFKGWGILQDNSVEGNPTKDYIFHPVSYRIETADVTDDFVIDKDTTMGMRITQMAGLPDDQYTATIVITGTDISVKNDSGVPTPKNVYGTGQVSINGQMKQGFYTLYLDTAYTVKSGNPNVAFIMA